MNTMTSAQRGDQSKDRVLTTNSSLGSKASHLVDAELKRKKVVNASLLKRSTSKVNRFVAQAEAKIAAGEAAEASSFVVTTGGKKVQSTKVKNTARNKKEDRDVIEDETTAGDDDDEASEYKPTQVELTVVERSPRPSRSSSRLIKGAAKKDDVDRSLVAPTGITGVDAPKGRTKSRQKSSTELISAIVSNSDHVKSMKGGRRKKMISSNLNNDEKWERVMSRIVMTAASTSAAMRDTPTLRLSISQRTSTTVVLVSWIKASSHRLPPPSTCNSPWIVAR